MSNPSDNDVVNMHVVNVTTPAQYFHLLRRQMVRNYRKPLIVASPKILLRHNKCVSTLVEDMGLNSKFEPVLDDREANKELANIMLFCSGKIYYDLQMEISKRKLVNYAVIRIEELCPFPKTQIMEIVGKYKNIKQMYYVQEEHQNQGAWTYVQPRLDHTLDKKIEYIGREPSACPATGVSKYHKEEVEALFNNIFANK